MNINALSRCGRRGLLIFFAGLLSLPLNAAVVAVTSLSDVDESDDFCTLREAIVAANTDVAYHGCTGGSGADEIIWLIPGTVVLMANLPIISDGVTMRGLGRHVSRVDGSGLYRLFEFPASMTGNDELKIEALRFSGGLNSDGGAIKIGASRSLHVVDSTFDGNSAVHSGGAIDARLAISVEIERTSILQNTAGSGSGGGISMFGGRLGVVESTIADNNATSGSGGGIEAYAVNQFLVERSTLSSNHAAAHGGGLHLVLGSSSGQIALVQSTTIIANVADQDESDSGFGGGIDVAGPGTLMLANNIVAMNRSLVTTTARCPDIDVRLNAVLVSQGYNLIGNNACASGALIPGLPNANKDFVGTDMATLDPETGPLSMNGGPTPTHLPLPDSILVDQGSCPNEITDQRGVQNPQTGLRVVDDLAIANHAEGCDIGAVEGSGIPPELLFSDGFDTSP